MSEKLLYKELHAQIFNLRFWVRSIDPKILKRAFDKILDETDFNILKFSEHHFPVKGYTALWLLAESHLAVHTFPDNGWTYVELSGCNKHKTHAFKRQVDSISIDIQWLSGDITSSVPQC